MNTVVAVSASGILKGIYAQSALAYTLGDANPPLLLPDHSPALLRVLAASVGSLASALAGTGIEPFNLPEQLGEMEIIQWAMPSELKNATSIVRPLIENALSADVLHRAWLESDDRQADKHRRQAAEAIAALRAVALCRTPVRILSSR